MKGYEFLSFAKTTDKSIINKYGEKLFDTTKYMVADAFKTASKRAIEKAAEEDGDLVGNNNAEKKQTLL